MPKAEAIESELDAARLAYARLRAECTARLIRAHAEILRLERAHARSLRGCVANAIVDRMPDLRARVGRPLKGPLARIGNLSQWAADHGLHYSTVKRWAARGRSGGRIPQHWAEVLLRDYGIPLKSWPRGISRRRRSLTRA